MRTLEIRRHTMRHKPGHNLSQEGVDLARRVGESMPKFDVVVTSNVPRAFQTAIAMGFAVDDEIEELGLMDDAGKDYEHWRTFADIAAALRADKGMRKYAEKMAKAWRRLVRLADDGGSVLAVSHGGVVEIGALACFPDTDPAGWGAMLDYCEGVRVVFDADAWLSHEILRVDRARAARLR